MIFVAIVAIFVVIAHMSCIWLGPVCFSLQRAPSSIIESSQNGTWLAPIGTIFISMLFLLCALYALSGAKIIKRLPLLKLAIYCISAICLARGILVIPILYIYPNLRSLFEISALILWFFCGFLIMWGYKAHESDSSR